jgi:hypothetical protein
MFVKLESTEDVSKLFDKLCEEYAEYCGDLAYQHVSLLNYNLATQTFPVVVSVEEDFDEGHTFVRFPAKVYSVEEL